MNLQSHRELEVTRMKLRMLEERVAAAELEQDADEYVREISQRSLKKLINQLKEEIIRFEIRAGIRPTDANSGVSGS
ncbi:MAG: hypothetical protein AB7O62_16145 [Pirellulales bacterium]